jgi:hypothetical protein
VRALNGLQERCAAATSNLMLNGFGDKTTSVSLELINFLQELRR